MVNTTKIILGNASDELNKTVGELRSNFEILKSAKPKKQNKFEIDPHTLCKDHFNYVKYSQRDIAERLYKTQLLLNSLIKDLEILTK